jgi:hypothetical protein
MEPSVPKLHKKGDKIRTLLEAKRIVRKAGYSIREASGPRVLEEIKPEVKALVYDFFDKTRKKMDTGYGDDLEDEFTEFTDALENRMGIPLPDGTVVRLTKDDTRDIIENESGDGDPNKMVDHIIRLYKDALLSAMYR